MKVKIFVASDHGGFEKKEIIKTFLKDNNYEVIDLGPDAYNSKDDYVDFGVKVARHVQADDNSRGILLCRSGIGMYMVANKFQNVRAGEVRSIVEAKTDRAHHNTNILVLGGDMHYEDKIEEIISTWLETEFEGGRHERRIRKMRLIEMDNISKFRAGPRVVPNITVDNTEDAKNLALEYKKFSNMIHADIMDGKYVPSLSPTIDEMIETLDAIDAYYSWHIMVDEPKPIIERLGNHKNVINILSPVETVTLDLLQPEYSFDMGVFVRPDQEVGKYTEIIMNSSIVMVMTVMPGYYGSPFVPEALQKINQLRELGFEGEIHLDGGINENTIQQILKYSPDVLYIGSAVAKAEDKHAKFDTLCMLANQKI